MKTTHGFALGLILLGLAGSERAFAVDPATACSAGTVRGTCNGVSGYPVRFDAASPTGVSPLCPPYNNPVVLFAPHPDDETLAMSGIARAAKDASRQVIVELMTNGDQSGTPQCLGAQGVNGECGKNRCREFMHAMQALGVDGVTINNFGDKTLLSNQDSACPTPGTATPVAGKVPSRIQFWTAMNGTAAISGCLALRGTVGYEDGNGSGGAQCHADHVAVRLALQNAGYADTRWFAVYMHSGLDRFNTSSGAGANYDHEPITPAQCSGGVRPALNSYMSPNPTTMGYDGAQGAFNAEDADCQNGVAVSLALKNPSYSSCFGAGGSCGEGTCVNPDGQYISHFTGSACDGTESYYLPYDGYAYQCRPYPSTGASCGTIHRTVTNRSYRYNGQCFQDAWPAGNQLTDFVTVYRSSPGYCGEASCTVPDGAYISHFTGPNCDGTESYYLPYDGFAYHCRPYNSAGVHCGTVHRTVTNYSYRYNGQCYPNAWPGGNTLTDFVTVYR